MEQTREDILATITTAIEDNMVEAWNSRSRELQEDEEYHHSEDDIRSDFGSSFEDKMGFYNFAVNKLMKDKTFMDYMSKLAKDISETEELGY